MFIIWRIRKPGGDSDSNIQCSSFSKEKLQNYNNSFVIKCYWFSIKILRFKEITKLYYFRTFSIGHTKLKNQRGRSNQRSSAGPVRTVKQFQYTCWGDHDTPSNPLPLLSFIKKSSGAAAKNPAVPLVVHCSAGVGRSGTYIVIDAILRQLKSKGELSIIPFLSHIRSQV